VHFLIYILGYTLGSPSSHLNFLIYEENLVFFFISASWTNPACFPDGDGDGDNGGDGNDYGELPVVLQRPQDHRVRLEQVERVQALHTTRFIH
jgi:hypothetical protein